MMRETKRQQKERFKTLNEKKDALDERSRKMENTLEGVKKRQKDYSERTTRNEGEINKIKKEVVADNKDIQEI